ncbi:MAG: hypothetical protein L3J71_02920 [Victivallaceae bacterium]|nr:hypothetical protein [Victivallaceae bacterium]
MKKSITMFVAVAMGFMLNISTTFAAPGCCSIQQNKTATSTPTVKKAAVSCPKLKGMTATEKKAMMAKCQKMIQSCPKLKGMNKAEMQQAMKNCPKLKNMSAAEKKVMLEKCQKMIKDCPKLKGMSGAEKLKKMQQCPSLQKKTAVAGNDMPTKCPKAQAAEKTASTVDNCPWYKRWFGSHDDACKNNK